tara:strand:+ start:2705 stop:5116 length:2412 start_codon:yes stop_codon:yes gene_type:complete
MVYTNIVDAYRTHFILFSSNYNDDLSFIGTKINIKTYLPRQIITDSNCYQFRGTIFNETDFSSEVFKNRVIFSAKINDRKKRSITLLTQQNLFHNIKFIQKDNDFNKPRILFTKYNVTNNITNNNQYFFNPVNNSIDISFIKINDISLNINNTDNDIEIGIDGSRYLNLTRLSYFFNIYKPFVNSDYFKFKFSDFIDLSFILQNNTNITEYSNNLLEINSKNIHLTNNFASNNLINYDENNFTNLFNFDYLGPIHNHLSAMDVSTIFPFQFNQTNKYNFDNILLYNKINNISTIKYDLIYPNFSSTSNTIDSYTDICINFIVLKGFDYLSKNYGKIYLTSDFTYLNSRILGFNNNFYSTNTINLSGLDNSMVYLSLGNAITGITQKNLYTHMKLDIQSQEVTTETQFFKKLGNLNKIYFSSSVNSINVANTLKNRNYLLEENYDYNYTNILYNNIQESTQKNIDLNLLDFYHNYNSDFSQNIYNHRFNSLGLLNNEISSNQFDVSYVNTNNQFFINNRTDISYLDLEYRFRLNTISFNQPITNNSLNYDFRFNYNSTFDVDIFFTLNYNYGSSIDDLSFETLNDYSSRLLLNFHKIILTSNFVTPTGNNFTNIDCLFIYYDPYNDNTPEEFRYPYNNIEISNNPSIDTLSRAIELLPPAKTSVTNTTFIPARNGSNLSRKKIQGLIGLNDIPALLSIEPYDENFIIGRGFLNQYQIEEECKTDTQRVEDKLNSQKHISVKNPLVNNLNTNRVPRTRNFANIVRNRRQNQNLSTAETCETDPGTIQNYTTPFTNPLWSRSIKKP